MTDPRFRAHAVLPSERTQGFTSFEAAFRWLGEEMGKAHPKAFHGWINWRAPHGERVELVSIDTRWLHPIRAAADAKEDDSERDD